MPVIYEFYWFLYGKVRLKFGRNLTLEALLQSFNISR